MMYDSDLVKTISESRNLKPMQVDIRSEILLKRTDEHHHCSPLGDVEHLKKPGT
ncbi:hypothetical protein YC2023_057550 [Brassica napus]